MLITLITTISISTTLIVFECNLESLTSKNSTLCSPSVISRLPRRVATPRHEVRERRATGERGAYINPWRVVQMYFTYLFYHVPNIRTFFTLILYLFYYIHNIRTFLILIFIPILLHT